MANFVALTPPLGQQPWGTGFAPVFAFQPMAAGSPLDQIYPPLDAHFRVLILKKHPGTVFPDPDLEDVFPCPVPDPVHVKELWEKYIDVLEDTKICNDLPTTNLARFIEREVAEWVAEYNATQGPDIFDEACRSLMPMPTIKSKSKKRARQYAFEDDTIMDESRAAKLAKKDSSPNNTTSPSMKEHYEKAFPADLVIDRDSPAYLMALNYLKAYANSNEKYAHGIKEIIEKQGIDHITQRCAKFFAWGLKQAIRSAKSEGAEVTNQIITMPDSEDCESSENDDSDESDEDDSEESDGSDSDDSDEVINFQPSDKKPTFKFEKPLIGDRLASFIPELKDANDKLAADLEGAQDVSIEIERSDDEHIEMNLGLGVLEEQAGKEDPELTSEDGPEVTGEEKVLIEEL